jgi:probable rRNA maturation factor
LEVAVLNRQRRRRISRERIGAIVKQAAESLQASGREVTLVLGTDKLLKDLNSRFRNRPYATDVLAFSANGGDALGDVVISVEAAARQARQRAHSLDKELAILAIHGLLHLLGHDHETDNGKMRRLEARLHRNLPRTKSGSGKKRRAHHRARRAK